MKTLKTGLIENISIMVSLITWVLMCMTWVPGLNPSKPEWSLLLSRVFILKKNKWASGLKTISGLQKMATKT